MAKTEPVVSKEPQRIEKLLYNKREAAFALGISTRSIERMLANKQLRLRKCGRVILIPAADIRAISKLEQIMEA